ncbi:MAG TPA: hypothetical protein VN628_17280, partial [Vicinamibacterales bacterium]|nr:hypothetical protein [Vicinamibacterales bacterium]
MRRRIPLSAVALVLALAPGFSACTSTQTSTGITAPSEQKCQVQVSNTPSTFTDAGGSGSLAISATRDCGWSIATNTNWVSIPSSSASGQGDASISYSVAANTVPQARNGAITVGDQTVQLTQAAAPCRYSLSKTSDSVGFAGGSTTITVTTFAGCGWTTASDSGWLTITSNASGNATAVVGIGVALNAGPSRVGHA